MVPLHVPLIYYAKHGPPRTTTTKIKNKQTKIIPLAIRRRSIHIFDAKVAVCRTAWNSLLGEVGGLEGLQPLQYGGEQRAVLGLRVPAVAHKPLEVLVRVGRERRLLAFSYCTHDLVRVHISVRQFLCARVRYMKGTQGYREREREAAARVSGAPKESCRTSTRRMPRRRRSTAWMIIRRVRAGACRCKAYVDENLRSAPPHRVLLMRENLAGERCPRFSEEERTTERTGQEAYQSQ